MKILFFVSCDVIFIEIVKFYFSWVIYFLEEEVRYLLNIINEEFIIEVNVIISEGWILLKIKKVGIVLWVVVLLYVFNVVID